MAGELAYDPGTGKLVYSPATGQLAKDCTPPVTCDCEGHGPITVTITATGGCDTDPGCGNICVNGVGELTWSVDNQWWTGNAGPSNEWYILLSCTDDVWTIHLEGGCFDIVANVCFWEVTFEPEDCEWDNGDGYPTHSGIDMDTPTEDRCWDDCQPTVALS